MQGRSEARRDSVAASIVIPNHRCPAIPPSELAWDQAALPGGGAHEPRRLHSRQRANPFNDVLQETNLLPGLRVAHLGQAEVHGQYAIDRHAEISTSAAVDSSSTADPAPTSSTTVRLTSSTSQQPLTQASPRRPGTVSP